MILINGLPHFGRKLAQDLNDLKGKHRFIFLNTYYSKKDKLKYFLLLPFSKMLISFNGVTDNSNALNWAMFWKKKIIMQWHGSDVLLAIERLKDETIKNRYLKKSTHFSDSDELLKELKPIIPQAKLVHFKYVSKKAVNYSYSKIEALTYIGQDNEKFYGWSKIKKLAVDNPQIVFNVVGSNSIDDHKFDNIKSYGWISKKELNKLYKKCAIFIRLTDHDGFALTVLEAKSYGCEVIWSQDDHFDHHDYDDLRAQFSQSIDKIKERGMKPNQEYLKELKLHFSKEHIIGNYYNEVVDALEN